RIRQRVRVLHRLSVDRRAHRKLGNLAGDGARDIGDLQDLCRHMARSGIGADLLANFVAECIVELEAFAQAHEQHDAFVALPVLADRDRLQYLGKLFDLPIDFGGADAYAAGIQRGVGTTVDDDPVVRGEFGPVAVAPHAGYLGEIGRTVFLAFWIIPELHG